MICFTNSQRMVKTSEGKIGAERVVRCKVVDTEARAHSSAFGVGTCATSSPSPTHIRENALALEQEPDHLSQVEDCHSKVT